jgi:hypothetical protein
MAGPDAIEEHALDAEACTSNNGDETTDSRSGSPLQAARRHCLWCCNGSANEVCFCAATGCPSARANRPVSGHFLAGMARAGPGSGDLVVV